MLAGVLAKIAELEGFLVFHHAFSETRGAVATKAHTFATYIIRRLCETTILNQNVLSGDIYDDIETLLPLAERRAAPDLDDLLKLLDSLLPKLPRSAVIVDALDECQDLQAHRLFSFLKSLGQRPGFKVIVLSRQNRSLTSIFGEEHHIIMNQNNVGPDIERFVRAEIARTKKLKGLESRVLAKVSADFADLFLGVKFLLRDLKEADTPNEQLEILQGYPANLFDQFERPFSQSGSTGRSIFLMLISARRPLTPDEISAFFSLNLPGNEFFDPIDVIEKRCVPLVDFKDGFVHIAHNAVRDFLMVRHGMTSDDSNEYLAEKCVSKLIQEEYSSLTTVGILLRRHLLPSDFVSSDEAQEDNEVLYEYAALNWQDHLVALPNPSDTLLEKAASFIKSPAAVTWSERLVDILKRGTRANIAKVIDVLASLTGWVKFLQPEKQAKFPIEDFFVRSHELVRERFAEDGRDKLLPLLPAVRLGQFFNVGGKSYDELMRGFQYDKIVADGLVKVLGPDSPLALNARKVMINDYFFQNRIDEAESDLDEVTQTLSKVVGKDDERYLSTLQLLGNTQFYLTKYELACTTLQESGEGLQRLLGNDHMVYLFNLLYYSYVLERRGWLQKARETLETLWSTWTPQNGESHPLSLMAQTAVSSIYRKQEEYDLAESNLLLAYKSRIRLFTIDSKTTVDSGIQLVLSYRDMHKTDSAIELLDVIDKSSVFKDDFERFCQVVHIRALAQFDKGAYREPVQKLTMLIDQTVGEMREKNNRECLWIRITLADALRHRGNDGEALMLFSELVKPIHEEPDLQPESPSLDDEPETTGQLWVAEQALRLVRKADVNGAQKLLEENGLKWARPKDFWISPGGPITDTAVIRVVTFEKST